MQVCVRAVFKEKIQRKVIGEPFRFGKVDSEIGTDTEAPACGYGNLMTECIDGHNLRLKKRIQCSAGAAPLYRIIGSRIHLLQLPINTPVHFRRRLVRKGEGKDMFNLIVFFGNQVHIPACQNLRLARTGARRHNGIFIRFYRLFLMFV